MHKNLLITFSILLLLFAAVLGAFLVLKNVRASGTNLATPSLTSEGRNLVKSPIDSYYAPSANNSKVLAAVGKGDSRPVIVDNFLARHRSPMSGLGTIFVSTADKYGLDYRLLPAIAFQESTLGKNIPRNSHNAWGWAIYTGAQSGVQFRDWPQAIDTVAKGLKFDYIDRGLDTPETIMGRYADSPNGSWAFGVNFAIDEMTPK